MRPSAPSKVMKLLLLWVRPWMQRYSASAFQ